MVTQPPPSTVQTPQPFTAPRVQAGYQPSLRQQGGDQRHAHADQHADSALAHAAGPAADGQYRQRGDVESGQAGSEQEVIPDEGEHDQGGGDHGRPSERQDDAD